MEHPPRQRQAQLFTLRIWRQVLDSGEVEWRGRVERVLGGEAYYFRGWDMLIEQLTAKLLCDKTDATESCRTGDQ